MGTVITIAVIAILFALACRFLYREKKKGRQCIGCPMADSCTLKGSLKKDGSGCNKDSFSQQ